MLRRRPPPPAFSRFTATSIRGRPRMALPSNLPAAVTWCSPSTRPATATAIRPPSPTALAGPTDWRICPASTSSTRTISGSRATPWAAGPFSPPRPRCRTITSRWCWRDRRPASHSPPTARQAGRAMLLWGVDRARAVTQSPKLWAMFGTQGAVEPGKVYGDIAQGTARVLYTPAITHPAEHISDQAIGYSLDWFAKTLEGGTPRPADDEIWLRKEIGTLIALIGFVALLIGVFDGLLEGPMFSHLRWPEIADGTMPAHVAANGRRRTTAFVLSAFIPALTYYPAFALAGAFVKPSVFLPQGITNQMMVCAIINGLITLALMPFAPKRPSRIGIVVPSILIAVATVIVGYAALWLADLAFKIDFRFWIVALKLMSAKQFLIFLIYLVPFTAFFVIALHLLHRNFSTLAAGRGALYF